jgi:hypothetical protein
MSQPKNGGPALGKVFDRNHCFVRKRRQNGSFVPKKSQSVENKAYECDPAIFTCVLNRNEVKRGRRATAGARKGGRLGVHLRVSIHVEGLELFRRHSIKTIDARLHV